LSGFVAVQHDAYSKEDVSFDWHLMRSTALFRDGRLNLGVVKWPGFENKSNSQPRPAPRHTTGDFFVVLGHVFEHGGAAHL
jgi:hypothetical protein